MINNRIQMNFKDLLRCLGITNNCLKSENFEIKGISCNSKEVKKGFVFVAIKGSCQDGNSFIDEAKAKGAKAIILQGKDQRVNNLRGVFFITVKNSRKALAKLAAVFFGNPSSKVKVIGITGTNGKTTVAYLIEALLFKAGLSAGVIGTINYRFKGKIIISKNTTPGPIELQFLLAEMAEKNIDYAAIEASSHALDQGRTEQIDFHSAIFTNLTQDHLDYHKTLKNYFLAKAKLFKNMSPESFVVINNDDKHARFLKKLTPARIITYGIKNSAEVRAEDIKFNSSYSEFLIKYLKGNIKVRSRLIGLYNIYNILAVASWGIKEGIDLSDIKNAIRGISFVPGRLERIDLFKRFSVFVDYAHTEDALANVIQTLRQVCKRRIIVVFGCGGGRDKIKRPLMGSVVSELADFAIITTDNPRLEAPLQIIEDIKKGINKNNYCIIPDRLEAIRKSLFMAKPGDIVLVAGKGHENYQVLKDKTIHFDDRQAIRGCFFDIKKNQL
ncbi:MAG: UDP-N-acetylmuramoyl-L-alanyl-D-glutamate--2,6-diaminopimelate ligase [Candidatus Omnitrophota bacterium]|nr:UDP-N-acetylmuramoyl-L-alanyl-D-glutamate--2,6-diaminopimelate ligase [Candidatus Omnitrophota bacterium]